MKERSSRNNVSKLNVKEPSDALAGEQPVSEGARIFGGRLNQSTLCMASLPNAAAGVLGYVASLADIPQVDLRARRVELGELALPYEFWEVALNKASILDVIR